MKLLADSGLWSTGPTVSPAPAVAVLEVSGAVLAWTVDGSPEATSPRITFTDVATAEWLWRVVGVAGHTALVVALSDEPPGDAVDVGGIDLLPESVKALRRLAFGHWLRRWWPASARDGIASLDRSLLDGEVALLTAAAQDYFPEDTLDSDVVELLAPHRTSMLVHKSAGDPRVGELVGACMELADEVGAWESSESLATLDDSSSRRRDDYALAAGAESPGSATAAIATGVGSVDWMAVPPGVFDAADDTIAWTVEAKDGAAVALIRVAQLGQASPKGIQVRVNSGAITGTGVLDVNGRGGVPLVDGDQRVLAESPAWNHDWTTTSVRIGADVPEAADAAEIRERIRAFARRRLAAPGSDAYLAEVLAAESDY